MKEKTMEIETKIETTPTPIQLSSKDASRILDNVLAACGMPPCKIPFEILEERVRKGKIS
ncbi:MAG: hypothetical protein HDR23_03110 [Lachnospiraceae bacterium]|nr:hypothetical protein [Lachnospiraceae bacterium]MBD5455460.1 hypothetical protein [Lachnospiraceae bacterium]